MEDKPVRLMEDKPVRLMEDKPVRLMKDKPVRLWEDKEYSYYEATQKQRQIERTIRKYKHRVMMYDKVGDKDNKLIAQIRLQRNMNLYKRFNKAGKLRPTSVNSHVYGYNRSRYNDEVKQSNRYKIYKERISGNYWNGATFYSDRLVKKHIDKHIEEFGNISSHEYLSKARKLLNAEFSDDIEGFMTNEKFIFKYNIIKNEFAVGREDGHISTYFKPKPGRDYWESEKKKYDIFK